MPLILSHELRIKSNHLNRRVLILNIGRESSHYYSKLAEYTDGVTVSNKERYEEIKQQHKETFEYQKEKLIKLDLQISFEEALYLDSCPIDIAEDRIQAYVDSRYSTLIKSTEVIKYDEYFYWVDRINEGLTFGRDPEFRQFNSESAQRQVNHYLAEIEAANEKRIGTCKIFISQAVSRIPIWNPDLSIVDV